MGENLLRLKLVRPDFILDVDLALPGRGVTVLFGPSGSGKTTLLRCVAGLEQGAQGYVGIGEECWQDDARALFVPTHRRALGYVFQEASLFAQVDVRANLRYGMKLSGRGADEAALREMTYLLGIELLLARRPERLSGGERQRVAIARALATSPRLLLMDEPLAALDAARKAELLPYFERLQRELRIPLLYVSHSLDEVARLATHMVLLDAGRVRASGATGELLTRLDLPLAHGDHAGAVIDGALAAIDQRWNLLEVRFAGGVLHCVQAAGSPPRQVGERLRLRVLARDVSLALAPASDTSILNVLPATVHSLTDDGPAQTLVALDLAGSTLLARVTRKSAAALRLSAGQRVFAQVKGVAVLD